MEIRMSTFGHKDLASYLLNKSAEKKNDSLQALFESKLEFLETTKIFNKRIVNLNNLPPSLGIKNRTSGSFIRACHGTQQNTAKSLDLLRQIVQNSINAEIGKVISKYIDLYFLPAKRNIAINNETNEVSPEHLQNVCCQILEEAKKMYMMNYQVEGEVECENIVPKRRKRTFSSGSDSKIAFMAKKIRYSPFPNKAGSGRSTPNKGKFVEPIKKEGPRWDSDRMTTETLFIMGSKANKALGLGATRGRLYIKHPDIFKYAGDQDDKQWLYEKMHMPATGGRTYLLMVDDILHLAKTDEYRTSPGLVVKEMVGFTVPSWMVEKMQHQMDSQRTDKHLKNISKNDLESVPKIATERTKQKHGTDSEQSSEIQFAEDTNGDDTIEDNDDPQDRDYTCSDDII